MRQATFWLNVNTEMMVRGLGIDKGALLRRARLPLDLFEHDDVRLPTDRFFDLWRAVEHLAAHPAFPIAFVEAISDDHFAPCLFSALCSPNLRTAAERLDLYKRVTAPMALTLDEDDGDLRVGPVWLDTDITAPWSLIASELTYLVQIARLGLRQRVVPVKVESRRPLEPIGAYTDWLGVAPQVSSRDAVTFAAADVEAPFLTRNAGMWSLFEGDLKRRLDALNRESTLAERIRATLLQALPSGQGTLEHVADALGLSTRTLQRRLRGEGESFRGVLTRTRQDLARHYLTTTRITASEVAFLLGFDDPGSFFRAYGGWTGTTPDATRQQAMAS